MTVETDLPKATGSGSSLDLPKTNPSARYPSLLCALWAEFPLPEWIPTAGDETWQKTIRAITQLWREAGSYGMVISGPVPWLPVQEWSHQPESSHWQLSETVSSHDEATNQRTVSTPFSNRRADHTTDATVSYAEVFRWLFTTDPDLSSRSVSGSGQTLIPISSEDLLVQEQFLMLITPVFTALVAQGHHPRTGQQGIMLSFEPEVVQRAGQVLMARVQHSRPDRLALWKTALYALPLHPPHHRVIARFSSLLLMSDSTLLELSSLAQLPTQASASQESPGSAFYASSLALPSETLSPLSPRPYLDRDHGGDDEADTTSSISEAELLQALAHDIRTPLTAILTHARLALRQKSLEKARTFMKRIEQECRDQIEKFDLIYQAAEMKPKHLHLGPTALTDLVQQNLSKWRSQVERQGSTLEVEIPDDLTDVMSDPQTLDTILSGMIRQLARNSPPNSQVTARFTNAGELVKLQFQVTTDGDLDHPAMTMKPRQAIGQLLMLQPETGAISLSIPVTRTLFRALGGYLTFKRRAKQGETLTIYLPRQI